MNDSPTPIPLDVADRLVAATNAHDLEALVACFADDYVLTNPAHPGRSFSGTAQVRRNWAMIFAAVPDLVCTVRARADSHATDDPRAAVVWLEMAMTGTRRDGAPHELVGVMVFGVRDDRIVTGRFFIEPVDHASIDADAAVRATVAVTR